MTYHQLLQKLYACTLHGMKLGLENVLKLDAALGYPTHKLQTIHIAGTNGKGSVATKIARGLQAAGLTVGLYTSPHIATFRERITINGTLIDEQSVSLILEEIFDICTREKISATFFEITTMLGFKYFETKQVDWAVIETGLGGRLDATNIINPLLSVITSISLDHTELLGSTLESIANEKAGVIKPTIPLVIGPRVPLNIIQPIARAKDCPCFQVEGPFNDFEEENQGIAKKALEILNVPPEAIAYGLLQMPKCRLEMHGQVILDVAHNPDGLEQLFKALKRRHPGATFQVVAAFSKSKDIKSCLNILIANADHVHLTQADHPRAAAVSELERWVTDTSRITFNSNLSMALKTAQAEAARQQHFLIICGTFFIMAAVRKILGIVEPNDDLPLVERT